MSGSNSCKPGKVGPRIWLSGPLILLLSLILPACAPTFSELQSAKLVGPGRLEVTPSYSSVSWSNEGESEKVQDHVGLQLATGVSDRTDLRFRYEYIDMEGSAVHVLGAGPKFGIVPDRVAFYVPVGTALGDDVETSESFQVQPTALFTLPVSNQVEVTASGKALLWVDRDNDDLLAFNLGGGLSSDLSKWAVRPEGGILINPGEDGKFFHFSIGFSYFADFGGRK
jgi:hypothetical protein